MPNVSGAHSGVLTYLGLTPRLFFGAHEVRGIFVSVNLLNFEFSFATSLHCAGPHSRHFHFFRATICAAPFDFSWGKRFCCSCSSLRFSDEESFFFHSSSRALL